LLFTNRSVESHRQIDLNDRTKSLTGFRPFQHGQTPNLVAGLVVSLFNFALKMHQTGRLQDAFAAYHEILKFDPEHYESIHLIGVIYIQIKQPQKALPYLNRAIKYNNHFAAAYSNRGRALEDLEDYNNALDDYNKAVLLEPNNISFIKNQINILRRQKNYSEALASISKILLLTPDDVEVLNNKGVILFDQKKYDEAIICYQRALALQPNFPECLSNYANSLAALRNFDESLEKYSKAITLNPEYHLAYLNRGHIYKILQCLPRALNDYQKAISLAPSDPHTHWNASLCLLTLKNFEDGWSKYEARLDIKELDIFGLDTSIPPSISISHHLLRPAYRGKRVYIASEQGIGDEIMFMSILPDLLEDAQHVTVKCYARSLTLLTRSFPSVKFIDKTRGEEIAVDDIDIAIRIGSLGYSYRRDMSTASGKPYLKTDPLKVGSWKRELPTDRPLIGLSWRGGTDRTNREGRTATLDDLRPLLERNEYKFVSLQHGEVSEELERFNLTVSNPIEFFPADRLRDLDDLAALIDTLDVVVSVQNTNVHLSGALGKTCFAMMPKVPEWRYGFEGTRMDWYKSVELMRPKDYGNFGGMARALQAKISRYLNGRSYDSE